MMPPNTFRHRTGPLVARLAGEKGNLLINPLMRARRTEKRNVLTHDTAQMCLVDDQRRVQAFFPDRAYPPFRVCVRIRGMMRNGDHMDTCRPEHRVVGTAELLVVVAD